MIKANTQPTDDLYDNLILAYQHFNDVLFDGKLPNCVITVQRKANTFGYFSPNRWGSSSLNRETAHEIALNPAYFAGRPVIELFQTIVHEMAHMWQHEFGKPSIKTYHNKEWANKMEGIGLMPSNTGLPGGARTGQQMMDYPVESGLFMRSCHALITSKGFKLPWIDRVFSPPAVPHMLTQQFLDKPQREPTEANAESVEYEAVAEYLMQEIKIEDAIQTASTPDSKQTFICPSDGCNQRCWGKPTLQIKCAVHDLQMNRV